MGDPIEFSHYFRLRGEYNLLPLTSEEKYFLAKSNLGMRYFAQTFFALAPVLEFNIDNENQRTTTSSSKSVYFRLRICKILTY